MGFWKWRWHDSTGENVPVTHPDHLLTLASVCIQIPRYIITLHELLAHTPHEHVERKSLEFAKSKLEELSRYVGNW